MQERHVNGGTLRRRNLGATLGDVGRSKERQMRHYINPPKQWQRYRSVDLEGKPWPRPSLRYLMMLPMGK